jgi:outer membrane protease
MKNITALTILVIIINILTPNSAFCQEADTYGFSIGAQTGFIYGQAVEIVYPLPQETKNKFLSELIWDMKPVFYLGAQAQFSRADIFSGPGFFSSLSFKAGIPADSGTMEDRDWMSAANSDLTHFSSHTNRTRQFFAFDAAIGATLPVKTFFYFKPFIGFSWMRFAFTGRDGYGSYPWGNESFLGKEVIRYRQDWLLFSMGLCAAVKVLPQLTFELSFKISPYTYCADVDEHLDTSDEKLLTAAEYRDFTDWGLHLEPSFNVTYSVKRVDFMLNFAFRKIENTSGVIYMNKKNTEFKLSSNKAGAGLSMFDTSLLVKIRLF